TTSRFCNHWHRDFQIQWDTQTGRNLSLFFAQQHGFMKIDMVEYSPLQHIFLQGEGELSEVTNIEALWNEY
uniref:Uncharacterized protein n=1 Tax=Romanomermis culicivorax TaxID=13658 RepID=A0A915L5J5_ROMCU